MGLRSLVCLSFAVGSFVLLSRTRALDLDGCLQSSMSFEINEDNPVWMSKEIHLSNVVRTNYLSVTNFQVSTQIKVNGTSDGDTFEDVIVSVVASRDNGNYSSVLIEGGNMYNDTNEEEFSDEDLSSDFAGLTLDLHSGNNAFALKIELSDTSESSSEDFSPQNHDSRVTGTLESFCLDVTVDLGRQLYYPMRESLSQYDFVKCKLGVNQRIPEEDHESNLYESHITVDEETLSWFQSDENWQPEQRVVDVSTYLDLEHTFFSDLKVNLNHSRGDAISETEATLFDSNCPLVDAHFRALINSNATVDVTEYCGELDSANVTVRAKDDLRHYFDGGTMMGDWWLKISDYVVSYDHGTLGEWCLAAKKWPGFLECRQPNSKVPLHATATVDRGYTIETLGLSSESTIGLSEVMSHIENAEQDYDLVVLVDVDHTWLGDLDFFLSADAVNGDDDRLTAELAKDRCSWQQNLKSLFTDSANIDLNYVCRSRELDVRVDQKTWWFKPLDSLAVVFEEYLSYPDNLDDSRWNLTIIDKYSGDQGTLREWCVGMTLREFHTPTTTLPQFDFEGDVVQCKDGPIAVPKDHTEDGQIVDIEFEMNEDWFTQSTNLTSDKHGLRIKDVRVFIDIDHSYVGDLNITLHPPTENQKKKDCDDNCPTSIVFGMHCTGDDKLYLYFDDRAANEIEDFCHTPRLSDGEFRVQPSSAFSVFKGMNGKGNWTLRIHDNYYGDSGVLNEICLSIDASEADKGEFSSSSNSNNNPRTSHIVVMIILSVAAVVGLLYLFWKWYGEQSMSLNNTGGLANEQARVDDLSVEDVELDVADYNNNQTNFQPTETR